MMDAQRKGITGVPFTVINQKYAITGAQKADAYVEVNTHAGQTQLDAILTNLRMHRQIFNKLVTVGDVFGMDATLEACPITAQNREICA